MHTIEIPHINFHQEIPSNISELSQAQYISFIELYLKVVAGDLSYEQFRICLLHQFIGFDCPLKKLKPQEKDHIYTEIFRLSELMDSFTVRVMVDGKEKIEVETASITNHIPRFTQEGIVYAGPNDALGDISFFEYIEAHNAYYDFVTNSEEAALNRLVAVLYRPQIPNLDELKKSPEWDGQTRQKFNTHIVDHRSEVFASLPYEMKYGIFLFFNACEKFLRDGEIPLGGSLIKLSALYESTGIDSSDNTGLIGVLFTLAESQVFGDAQKTSETNLYDVMVRLYQLMRNYNDQKKLLQQHDKTK
ncbi:MAG: hypothetical protein AB9842_08175 [Bacteroidales bacterium]